MPIVTPEAEVVPARAADPAGDGEAYDRLDARAHRAVARDALAAAVSALRKLLHSDDPDNVLQAAECLARVGMTYVRHRLGREKAGRPGQFLSRLTPSRPTARPTRPT